MEAFGFLANIIDAVVLTFGKTGKFLNARGNRICFIIESICLTYWIYMDCNRGLYAQGISALISILIAVYGYYNWGKRGNLKKDGISIQPPK